MQLQLVLYLPKKSAVLEDLKDKLRPSAATQPANSGSTVAVTAGSGTSSVFAEIAHLPRSVGSGLQPAVAYLPKTAALLEDLKEKLLPQAAAPQTAISGAPVTVSLTASLYYRMHAALTHARRLMRRDPACRRFGCFTCPYQRGKASMQQELSRAHAIAAVCSLASVFVLQPYFGHCRCSPRT